MLITEIYPSREKKIKGVDSKMIFDEFQGVEAHLLDKIEILKKVPEIVNDNDMIIVMGAGDIKGITKQVYNEIK